MENGLFSIFFSLSLLTVIINGQTQTTDIQELAGRNADFATGLYRAMAMMSDDNVAVSPLAATLGLASLAAGAAEETRKDLLRGLSLTPMERDGEPDRIPALLQQLKETTAQNLVTGLFTSKQIQADSSFSNQVKSFFGTDVQSVDFSSGKAARDSINNFVTSGTGKQENREVVNILDPQSQLMLVSGAYFTGQWRLPFNATFTQQERFYVDKYHIVQVPMMVRSDRFYLAYDPSLKVGILRLPCMDGTAILFLLPDEDVDYTYVDEALTSEVFHKWVLKLKKTKLEVQLPKFSLEQSFSLKPSLSSLGITKIFENGADLSGISKSSDLKLSQAVQKISVEVDETGNSPAPTSSSFFIDPLPPRLTFNRPFLFIVYHENTKTLLHMGRVVDPTKN